MSWLAALVLVGAVGTGTARAAGPLDRSIAVTWRAENQWDESFEDEYAAFVERLGAAVSAQWCSRLDQCLSDPVSNSIYDEATDAGMSLAVDCADLAYVLRAYYSFKRKLPFGFVATTYGEGFDIRYAVRVRPVEWRTWRDFHTPRAVLRAIGDRVHTGMYRLASTMENGDFYPVRIDRRSVRPGAIYYDPLGHVSVVARVRRDGAVFFLEGTPQSILQWRRLGAAYAIGSASLGGGFKRFRPVTWSHGRLARAPNAARADFDDATQYDVTVRGAATFHDWVRATLAVDSATADAVAEFREHVRSLCRDVIDRVEAVDQAARDGIASRPHPRALPKNVYAAGGTWETYATPARDTRLRAAFHDLVVRTRVLDDLEGRAVVLREAWREEIAAPSCAIVYLDSRRDYVRLTLDDVLDRLLELSFDPYHCPELRWGAPRGSAERATCPDGKDKSEWFDAERRLRWRLDRTDAPMSLIDGPEQPPDVDVRRLFVDDGIELDL